MLSFFKKSNKNKNMPNFESGLIKKFSKEHKKLLKYTQNIKESAQERRELKAKEYLDDLKIEMLGHFMEEDNKLYWYLKAYYKEDPETMRTIKTFEESAKKVQRDITAFFKKYNDPSIYLDENFIQELEEVTNALDARIKIEEEKLYPLYIR